MADLDVFNSDYTAEQIEDEIENGVPYIDGSTKHWMRWDIDEQEYEDTGIYAEGSLQTSVNGILKGSSGTVVQAVAGTDYPTVASVTEKYTKPSSGIPDSDIASASTWNAKANTPTWVTSYTLASSSWVTTGSETKTGDGTATAFSLANTLIKSITSITIDGTATTDYTYTAATRTVTFTTAPTAGAVIVIAYSVVPTYSLESAYPFASYDVEISISPSATETQRDAYAEAMMTGSPSTNVITALGDAPTVDIPCYLKVRAK